MSHQRDTQADTNPLDPAPQAGSEGTSNGTPKGCSHIHTRKESRAALRKIARRSKPADARHWIVCTRSKSNQLKLRHYWRTQLKWRRSYTGYWTLQRRRLPPATLGVLVRLRSCESGGRYQIHNAPYSGAYQYLDGTWQRAQAWVGTPARYRTAAAYLASPAHQDSVTGRFYFAHRSEWACSG